MAKANGNRKKMTRPPQQLTDLLLTELGGVLTTTVSPNSQWGGIQFSPDGVFDAVGDKSISNWYNYASPGENQTKSVNHIGSGYYRSWTSDFDYTIHFSNILQIP